MRIAFVPIDNRPCTMTFPARLAEMAGIEVTTPPERLLGSFTTPGDPEGVAGWLESSTAADDFLVLSLDMLIHGGLIASRTARDDREECMARMDRAERLLSGRSPEKSAVFSTVMRSFPTFLDEKDVKNAEKLRKLLPRLYPDPPLTPGELGEMLRTEEEADPDMARLLPLYLSARSRNHSINMRACSWAKRGLVGRLLIGLDDVTCAGPNIQEGKLLANELKGIDGALACRGTDELPMTLLARILSDITGIRPSFSAVFSNEKGADSRTIYEQMTIRDLVREAVSTAGFEMREHGADVTLFCNVPEDRQMETEAQHLSLPRSKKAFAKTIANHLKAGMPAAVADLAYANGADVAFAKELTRQLDPVLLSGYAAWNTSGNTLGTVVPHSAIRFISERTGSFNHMRHAEFIFERLLDDCFYESVVRAKFKVRHLINGKLALSMDERQREIASKGVEKEMRRISKDLFEKRFRGRHRIPGGSIEISKMTDSFDLPWPRLFEIRAEAKFS